MVNPNFLQTVDQNTPAFIVGAPHSRHLLAGLSQRRNAGPLHKGISGNKKILHQFLERPHKLLGGNQVSQTPTGHGISLGETVDDKSPVGKLQNGMLFPFIHQPMINFIRDHIRP